MERPIRGDGVVATFGVMLVVLWFHRSALDAGFVFDDRVRIVEMESSIDQLWPPSPGSKGASGPSFD